MLHHYDVLLTHLTHVHAKARNGQFELDQTVSV